MPYIKESDRKLYDIWLSDPNNTIKEIKTKGDLEYCIFKLLLKYMKTRNQRYSDLHDATYACIHAADEFRRRFLDVREDKAREENGDIII